MNMNKRGITLIELVVVMVIIAIGATLTVPAIGRWIPSFRLRSATRDLVSTMRTAQVKAVTTNSSYGVAFGTSGANSYRVYRGANPDGPANLLPKGVAFENNTFPIDATLNKAFAAFNANSTSTSGGVTLTNSNGSHRITVMAATGRVRSEKID